MTRPPLAHRIASALTLGEWTQAQLALALGTSRHYVQRIVSEMHVHGVARICGSRKTRHGRPEYLWTRANA